jgi:hypothetical protein
MTINDQIQQLCRKFGGYLHCSASDTQITWHALQVRSSDDLNAGPYQQEMRSEAGHPTPEAAIEACLASEWREAAR